MQRYSEYKDSGVKWLGEIPSHWKMLALKHILRYKKDIVGSKFRLYDLLSLTLKGVIKRDMENPEGKFPASFVTYQKVQQNDFIFCNFDNEETPRAVGISPYDGMITGAYDVFNRKNSKLTDRFLTYYFLYIDDAKRLKPYYKGLRKTVPFDSFMAYKIPVPTLDEQEAIATYLDEATSKIDAAIAQQQRMIELLNERKQIIINNAITKGLDPNVKMKDSGVEWIGEIPEHWNTIRIKYLLKESKKRSMQGCEEPLSMSQLYGLIPTREMGTIPNMASSFVGAKIVEKGNLVFNKLKAHLGVFNVSEYDGLVSPDYAVYSSTGRANLSFLEYIFKTPKCIHEFVKLITGVGAGLSRLYTSDLFSIYCAIPPLDEQSEICLYIRTNILKIEQSINLYRKQISLLQERKQIIINDVVTGKVKVI